MPPSYLSSWLTIWLGSVAAVLAASAVLNRAPSYRAEAGIRSNPPGSDFLQEWIGGLILLDGDADRLYDWEYSKQLQHDPQRTGFAWTPDQFYPMVYPPFYYALVTPLARLDCLTAAREWCLVNGLAYCLAFAVLATACLRFHPQARWFPLLAVLFGPVLLSLNMGQKSGFLLLLFVATYALHSNRRPGWAGLIFGALLFKPHLTIVVVMAMVLRREWKFLTGFLVSSAVAAALSLWIGLQPCQEFLQVVLSAGRYMDHGGYQWEHAHNLWCGIRGFFPQDQLRLAALGFGLLGMLLVGWVIRSNPVESAPESLEQAEWFGKLVLLTILLSPHFFTYDLSLLIIPMAFVACRALVRSDGPATSPDVGSPSGIISNPAVVALPIAMYLTSTWLPAIAIWTGVQWSCWILAAWLVVWSCPRRPRHATWGQEVGGPEFDGANFKGANFKGQWTQGTEWIREPVAGS